MKDSQASDQDLESQSNDNFSDLAVNAESKITAHHLPLKLV